MVNQQTFPSRFDIGRELKLKISRERILKDFRVFVEEIFQLPCGPFHRKICDLIQSVEQRKGIIILSPRNSGKSTLASVAYPLFRILRNRDLRIIIVANTISQAREWLRQIENHLLYNPRLIELFGHLVPPPGHGTWTDTEKVVAGRSPFATHLSFLAVGLGGALLGRRADIIIVDDMIDLEVAWSEAASAHAKAWFLETLIPALDPGGEVIVIGTRWAATDLYHDLSKIYKDSFFVFRALEKGKSYWPERWPVSKLLELREQMGTLFFNCQYQNQPPSTTERLLVPEKLSILPALPEPGSRFIGVDPCISSRSKDYYSFAVIETSRKGKEYLILDLVRGHASLERQLELLSSLTERYEPKTIGIESNAAQDYFVQLARDRNLPVRALPSQEKKSLRFLRLRNLFESNRIFFRGEGNDILPSLRPLREELVNYPETEHDDTIDALLKAIEVSSSPGEPVSQVAEAPNFWYNQRRLWRNFGRDFFYESPTGRKRPFL